MIEIELNCKIKLTCSRCGNPLENSYYWAAENLLILDIDPCETCLENERDDWYDNGRNSGLEEGYEEGYKNGQEAGE